MQFFSSDAMYSWFFYLGIIFFVLNNLLYGLSVDIFAVLLIWLGYKKYSLSTWFTYFLWFMIFLDALTYVRVTIKRVRDAVFGSSPAKGSSLDVAKEEESEQEDDE